MKKHLIFYNDSEVISVVDVPEGGTLVNGTKMIIEELATVKVMFAAAGIDITVLEEYVEQNPEAETNEI